MKRSNARMNDAAGAFWKIERRGVTKVREVDTCGDLLITQVEVTFSPLKGSLKTPKKIQKGHWEGLVMMKKYSTIDVLILTELLRILSVVKVKNLNCIAFEVQSMSSLKDGTCNKNTIRKIRRTHDWWDSFWTYWCNKKTGFSTITKDCSWLLSVFYVCGISKLSNPGLLGTWSSRCVSHVKWLSWRRLQASHDVHESDCEHRDVFDTCLVVESYFGVSYRVNNSWPLLWYIIITHPSDWIRKKYTLSPSDIGIYWGHSISIGGGVKTMNGLTQQEEIDMNNLNPEPM